ncbi:XRE family transcriptional regulator [Kitasatospora xanthocidica]|uniref:XRE family transcriptional regulator n=1 Tax=Kitasatospora xanthocidica TaxID=83382 RepID=A0A372ZJX0_9ACTN|nr:MULTISPECIES: helix-turn-helix transcriptional regulator [Streptomycetaceae]OKI03894.1 XRE family transcriptional regulator [Streptomyces sp. CB02056]RGD56153.1 XRE family transcriptional regulator [Kitasatospora xanthocidica]
MTTVQPGGGSMVRRILLGSQLRRLREARGITREDAGYAIRASESKISRMELGRVSFKERDVADLLSLYGVDDGIEREALLGLVREANKSGWWHSFNDVLPGWFQTYVGLEEAAQLIRTYEVQFIPGLLQSEEYARAVFGQSRPVISEEEVERRVSLRLRRQKLLTEGASPRLWAVIDEAALRRPVGGPQVMRGQVQYLIDVAEQANVVIQVMPFRFGAHAGESGAFTILRFPEQDLADVVYLEQLTSALYLDKRDDVDAYIQVMERLCVDSLTPERTIDLLASILKER